MREPIEYVVDIGDVELCVYEWPGSGDPVMLLHATGFHSRCWNEVVLRLPEQHVYAIDIHFHGRSSNNGQVDWALFASDICALIKQLNLRNIIGVGHSIGGHLISRAAAALPDHFKQLVLLDPVIMSAKRGEQSRSNTAGLSAADHPVARRKNNWRDADEMYNRFVEREPFKYWKREVLRDYCDYALQPADEEGMRQLACNPINEASFYMNSVNHLDILAKLCDISAPTSVLRAPPGDAPEVNFSASPTWPELANAIPIARDVYLPDMDHFIPMRSPELVVTYINEALEDSWQHTSLT